MQNNKPSTKAVREPAQVYLAPDDSDLLLRLATDTGLSKAEVLRRGIRSFAREQTDLQSPMLAFIDASDNANWPSAVATNHDAILADSYVTAPKRRR